MVTIVNQSACSTCHARGSCNVSDFQDKEIEISHFSQDYKPGQEVTVIFKESKGFTALFYGYILPFILVLSTLIAALSVTNDELVSGLFSLGVLIPYYIIIYFFRDQFKKVFNFEVEETN